MAGGQGPGQNSGHLLAGQRPCQALPRCIETSSSTATPAIFVGLQGRSLSGDPTRSKEILNHNLAGDINIVARSPATRRRLGTGTGWKLLVTARASTSGLNGSDGHQANGRR